MRPFPRLSRRQDVSKYFLPLPEQRKAITYLPLTGKTPSENRKGRSQVAGVYGDEMAPSIGAPNHTIPLIFPALDCSGI